jgi:hypothetical protein
MIEDTTQEIVDDLRETIEVNRARIRDLEETQPVGWGLQVRQYQGEIRTCRSQLKELGYE